MISSTNSAEGYRFQIASAILGLPLLGPYRLNPHPFNPAKTHFVAAPVVEFRRFDVRVTRHSLGDVNVAAAFQIVRDTDGPERMIAYGRLDARIPRLFQAKR